MVKVEHGTSVIQESQSTTLRQRRLSDSGFECEFVDLSPRRSQCPICLLVPRDPHQTPCCGNAFCKTCIKKMEGQDQPCPTCKTNEFSSYPDKGLEQELYSCRVYCPKRSLSCDWEGELRELDKHLDGDGKDTADLKGCKFVAVCCSFCSELYPRGELEDHQKHECMKRPFTCTTCNHYTSNYDEVLSTHLSVCKCRPVDCPNKCGAVVQYQKLEDHFSSECELLEVECEFSHAGCDEKVLKKDLPLHMTDNMASHVSLLARENRQLKAEIVQLRQAINADKPPIQIIYPWKKYAYWSGPFCLITDESEWFSDPFYYGFHKLCLKVWCTRSKTPVTNAVSGVHLAYQLMESEDASNVTLLIQTIVLDQENGLHNIQKSLKVTPTSSDYMKISNFQIFECIQKESMFILVDKVIILKNSYGNSSNKTFW